jgi:hypothetical protein
MQIYKTTRCTLMTLAYRYLVVLLSLFFASRAHMRRASSFVLFPVNTDGNLLATGKPSSASGLPPLRERQANYRLVQGSKYAREADKLVRDVLVATD